MTKYSQQAKQLKVSRQDFQKTTNIKNPPKEERALNNSTSYDLLAIIGGLIFH
jgi:hypothetical protein